MMMTTPIDYGQIADDLYRAVCDSGPEGMYSVDMSRWITEHLPEGQALTEDVTITPDSRVVLIPDLSPDGVAVAREFHSRYRHRVIPRFVTILELALDGAALLSLPVAETEDDLTGDTPMWAPCRFQAVA